jgi:hypothetical protein
MKSRRCWAGLRPGRLITETRPPLTSEQIEERLRKQDYIIQQLQTQLNEIAKKLVERVEEERIEYTSKW